MIFWKYPGFEAGQTELYLQPTDLVTIINVVIREKAAEN